MLPTIYEMVTFLVLTSAKVGNQDHSFMLGVEAVDSILHGGKSAQSICHYHSLTSL